MAFVFKTNKGEGEHILDAPNAGVSSDVEGAGIPGGLTDAAKAVEEARVENAPQVSSAFAPDTDFAIPVLDPAAQRGEYEVSPLALHDFEPPRHDAFAAENSGFVADRVYPGGVTNAHPDFAVTNSGVVVDNPSEITSTDSVSTAGGGDEAQRTREQAQAQQEATESLEPLSPVDPEDAVVTDGGPPVVAVAPEVPEQSPDASVTEATGVRAGEIGLGDGAVTVETGRHVGEPAAE